MNMLNRKKKTKKNPTKVQVCMDIDVISSNNIFNIQDYRITLYKYSTQCARNQNHTF